MPEEFYVPDAGQIGVQSKDNKQMRELVEAKEEIMGLTVVHRDDAARVLVHATCEGCFRSYKALIAGGVPRESARGVLPANTYSHMFATVDLHNLMHFLKLRLHPHAQYEIRVYAEAMLNLIEPVVPHSIAAFRSTL